MAVRTDEGRTVAFDLKDYNRIDHGYAATIHKAQGMTVDRTHVLATPGLDAHGSYVALSRHRGSMDLHYGSDDFAGREVLARTLSRDRAKDMASDYERLDPARDYAERRGITFRAAPAREIAQDREAALGKARTDALARHARVVAAIFDVVDAGGKASPAQKRELGEARRAFEAVLPQGWRDAEAAYVKDDTLAHEVGAGRVGRAIRALQLETEIRADPARRADRFVERWRELGEASQRQYQAGDMSGYKATRAVMGDMARSLERDPQLESILDGRKRDLGIEAGTGRRLGLELAFAHGIDLGRGRSLGL